MQGSYSPRPIMFGEVLFDRFPDGSVVLGGAPFNVAWHLQAFGLSPLLVSKVGSDALGRIISSAMIDWGMDRSGLQLDSGHQTGTVEVTFDDGEPVFDIVNHRAFDHIDRFALPPIHTGGPLYFGSLALRNPVSRESLLELKQFSQGSCFVDVNLRPPWWQKDQVMELIQGVQTVKLNHFELQELVREEHDIESCAKLLLSKTKAETLVVTMGADGAMAFQADGASYKVKPAAEAVLVDTVGAGDAFSAVLLLGHWQGWELELTMHRAQVFASAIVGVRGSITRNRGFYQKFQEEWRAGYLADKSGAIASTHDNCEFVGF